MIAAVTGWHAVLAALLFLMAPEAWAGEDLAGAARDLARRTAAFAGKGEPVSVAWRNQSSLDSSDTAQARSAFETALKDAGLRISEIAPVAEIRLTFSQNQSQVLLVEEIRKGEDRQVWIGAAKRTAASDTATPGAVIEKQLIWELEEPILDAAYVGETWVVLTMSRLTLLARQNGRWEPGASVPVHPAKPWPRDPRGRLRVSGPVLLAYLPGTLCRGATEPSLTLDCAASDEPWVLDSGSSAMLVAGFAPTRNYFEGRVTTQAGVTRSVPPFYSAAEVDAQGGQVWLLAATDGIARMFNSSLEPVASIGSWGSDLAGIPAPCARGGAVLATKPGATGAPDAIQAFSIVDRAMTALTPAVDLPGPVTALWPGGARAIGIVRNLRTGRYEAYAFTLACGG